MWFPDQNWTLFEKKLIQECTFHDVNVRFDMLWHYTSKMKTFKKNHSCIDDHNLEIWILTKSGEKSSNDEKFLKLKQNEIKYSRKI